MCSPGEPGDGQGGDGSHHEDAGRVFEFAGTYDVFASDSESGAAHGSTAERLEPIVEEMIVGDVALSGTIVPGGGASGVAPAAVAVGGSELRPDIPAKCEGTGRLNLLETPEGRWALDGFLRGWKSIGGDGCVDGGWDEW
ncbi:uncharacterized protein IUM83_02026 [Phytophthora cinnamomi]|uniref:uncharacterized protein n=1 Tax=Phytophthora cinnamomi TaxID=4785 RepID=UPI003559B3A8|nr:hypothetical protein IUM83_02026 [Phytophthora cinnamomi]